MASKIIVSGDTWKVEGVRLDDYPSSEWTATLFLEGPSSAQIGGDNRPDGGFDFTLGPAASSNLEEGTYRYYIRFTSGSEAYTKVTDVVRVKENPATSTDKVMFAEEMVSLIEACLRGQLSAKEKIAAASVSVGGRSLAFLERSELISERNFWIRKLNKLRTKRPDVVSTPININSLLGNRR